MILTMLCHTTTIESRTHYLDEMHTHSSYNLVENVHHIISTRYTQQHTIATRFMHNNTREINSIGYTIKFQSPYDECEWRTQTFTTKEEAEGMIEFYKTCRTHAEFV
jgi:hypothetical protein